LKVFFVGGASQARLCYNILRKEGHEVPVVYDMTEGLTVPWGAPVFHDENAIPEHARSCEGFLVCIGDVHGYIRTRYSNQLRALGLAPVAAIHPTAWFGENVTLGAGLQAMARSVVTDDAGIGDYVILNTNCAVDHGCRLGTGVHIMGGAVLAGLVEVGDFSTVGSNATILPRLRVGSNCIVGAGAVVTRSVDDNTVVAGTPAAVIRQLPPLEAV
jgi:sugar O-acyltransferase (sialic acid O-acetyltransferase NeuD family)